MVNYFLPNLSLAKSVFRDTSLKLLSSMKYILEHFEKTDCSLYKITVENLDTPKASPFFFAAHEVISKCFIQSQSSSISLCESLLNIEKFTDFKNLSVHPFSLDAGLQEEAYLSAIRYDLRATYKDVDKNDALPKGFSDESDCLPTQKTIYEALEVIDQHAPELYEEIKFVVNEVRIFRSNYLRAGTNFNTLGLIYVGEKSSDDNVSRYIEHVVHEAAHNLLYAHWTTDPIFVNHTDELYYTPFRKDKRPLSAIYHAMFVLARTIYVFDRIWRSDQQAIDFSKIKTNYNEQGNSTPFKVKFSQTADVIYQNAELTEIGRSILDASCDMVNSAQVNI